jgi:hypothetical protein
MHAIKVYNDITDIYIIDLTQIYNIIHIITLLENNNILSIVAGQDIYNTNQGLDLI